jgi:hypothetical protein
VTLEQKCGWAMMIAGIGGAAWLAWESHKIEAADKAERDYWKNRSHELAKLSHEREARITEARDAEEAAKAETAMCRRAIGHADTAVENLEAALKAEREK